MRRRLKIFMTLIVILSILVLPVGCTKSSQTSGYLVYYTNTAGNKLVSQSYKTGTTENIQLVKELVGQMNTKQKQDDITIIKPDNVAIQSISVDDDTVSVNFSKEYNEMNNSTELLYRTGLVKMLTQIPGIVYVQFYVDGATAKFADGTLIGTMSADDFADDSSDTLGSVQWKDINLYYANKLGDKLIKTKVSVAYSKNVSLEKMVVVKLIKGPSDSSVFATLPADMKLLNVSVNNGVCYVNLDSSFLTEMVNVSSEIPIYSIVDSLCDLESVDSVKIMVNGDSSKTFRESISLDNTFTFNDTLIGQ